MDKNDTLVSAISQTSSQKLHDMKQNSGNKIVMVILGVVVLAAVFGAGVQYGQKHAVGAAAPKSGFSLFNSGDSQLSDKPPANAPTNFGLFWQVWNLVSSSYFDKSVIDPQKMYYGAISGMVAALGDPYTTFLPPSQNKEVKDDLGGNFEGVGMELGFKDNHLVVIAPLDDSPAQKAGVLAGDYITKINGEVTDGISLPEAVSKIRGPKDTKVTLEFYRQGDDKPFTLELTRQQIHVNSVTYTEKPGKIAVIKVARFGDETNSEWDKAVTQAMANGDKAIVIDVRNNPGGYLQSAIYIASDFINGPIVKQEQSNGTKQTISSDHMGRLLTMPVAVLINQGSASASEILSGAILANNRGKLIGETSFGKGTIQEVQDLEGGAGIHITKARWLLPNDFWVHKKGLKPDIEATMSAQDVKANKDPQLDKALEFIKTLIK